MSGTINYTPYYTSATTLSSTSSIYDNGVDIGIGTSSVGKGKISISPRGASAGIYILNATNNSFITYGSNTSTYSMGVYYDATNPYLAISGGPTIYSSGALGSYDRVRMYDDSINILINATSSNIGIGDTEMRKGELSISNFNGFGIEKKAYTSIILVGGYSTTTGGTVELKTDGLTSSSNNITIPTASSSAFLIYLHGQAENNASRAYFSRTTGVIVNSSGTTTLAGGGTPDTAYVDGIAPTVTVDATSNYLRIRVSSGSYNVRWIARIEMTTLGFTP